MRNTFDPTITAAADYVAERLEQEPVLAFVTGSGLAAVADAVAAETEISTSDIPGYPKSTVSGHPGKLISGKMAGVPVIIAQGRVHFYEGYPLDQVVFPTRLFAALGVRGMLLTTATGAINTEFEPGDLVLIRDHINLMAGNPLSGQAWGFDTFPDLTEAYHPGMRSMLWRAAGEEGIALREGVFVGVNGPSYETPAEIEFMRGIGGDIVSMSTVPEVIAAARLRLPVAAVAYVSNFAAGLSGQPLTHEEVTDRGLRVSDTFTRLFQAAAPLLQGHFDPVGG